MKRMNKMLLVAALAATTLSAQAEQKKGPAWLSDALFYQIYPSSYMDTDGNGIGDLPGITSKLDYIKSLGVNALWLNPIFESGWFDGGYDVIDFYKVDPRFGTNTDLVTLVNEAHKRGMKVCLDLVAGHSSTKCAWFKESSEKDPNQRYSDYYIWMNDIPENEKKEIEARHQEASPESSTRGRYVEANAPRAKYYEKNFFECQPALNYGFAHPNPNHPWEQSVDAPGPQAVRREIRNIMAFWFDKGVDGFRVDMASSLIKNDPDKKEVSKLWNEMRAWKDKYYPETVLISEWANPQQAIPAGFNIDFYIHFGLKGYASLFFDRKTPWGKWEQSYKNCYFDKQGKGSLKEFSENYTKAYNATKNLGYIAVPSANHALNCDLTIVPASTTAARILSYSPDGIMLSNGPGNPKDNPAIISELSHLCKSGIPIFGICLGHQLLALANGADTEKLKYGHRGANQPVKDLLTGRDYITSQNHGYAVKNDSLPDHAVLRFINLNDGTCEGVSYQDFPGFSVQFHPEACGGPHDSEFLFREFVALMERRA